MQFNLKRHVDTSLIRLRGSRARTNECDLDEVTQVDGLIGDILQRLEDDGLADNTIIVMMGDHGRAHPRGKKWPYDSGLMIPLIIYFPPTSPNLAASNPARCRIELWKRSITYSKGSTS